MTTYATAGPKAKPLTKLSREELSYALAACEQMRALIWHLIKSGKRQEDDREYQLYTEQFDLLVQEHRRRKII